MVNYKMRQDGTEVATVNVSLYVAQLADQVQAGKVSRSAVDREHGKDVGMSVRRELVRRREQQERDYPLIGERDPGLCKHCEKEISACECCLWCNDCGCLLSDSEIDDGITQCEDCKKKQVRCDWVDDMEREVTRLVVKYGWALDQTGGGLNTRSQYYLLAKDDQEIKLRISDHATCYCSEDISLAMEPSGDDSTLATLEDRLSR